MCSFHQRVDPPLVTARSASQQIAFENVCRLTSWRRYVCPSLKKQLQTLLFSRYFDV